MWGRARLPQRAKSLIQPTNRADHAAKMHELPDEHLVELLPAVKKIAVAVGVENYNVLQVSATDRRARQLAQPILTTFSSCTHRTTDASLTRRLTMCTST
jgi:hypothetical protein